MQVTAHPEHPNKHHGTPPSNTHTLIKFWRDSRKKKVEELQPVGAKMLWYEKYFYLYKKFIFLSVNEDDENVQIFNEKMFRILK